MPYKKINYMANPVSLDVHSAKKLIQKMCAGSESCYFAPKKIINFDLRQQPNRIYQLYKENSERLQKQQNSFFTHFVGVSGVVFIISAGCLLLSGPVSFIATAVLVSGVVLAYIWDQRRHARAKLDHVVKNAINENSRLFDNNGKETDIKIFDRNTTNAIEAILKGANDLESLRSYAKDNKEKGEIFYCLDMLYVLDSIEKTKEQFNVSDCNIY